MSGEGVSGCGGGIILGFLGTVPWQILMSAAPGWAWGWLLEVWELRELGKESIHLHLELVLLCLEVLLLHLHLLLLHLHLEKLSLDLILEIFLASSELMLELH